MSTFDLEACSDFVGLSLVYFFVQKGSFDAEKKTVQLQSSVVGNASKVRSDLAAQPLHNRLYPFSVLGLALNLSNSIIALLTGTSLL